MSTVFAGLDWASRTHAVCVIDERGAVCRQWEVAHDADGLRELHHQLQHDPPQHDAGRAVLRERQL